MTTYDFDYQRASSVDEALALMSEHGAEAKLLAGGHSLVPAMKLRLAAPSTLIDISELTRELAGIEEQLTGTSLSEGDIASAVEDMVTAGDMMEDLSGSLEYRAHLCAVQTKKALRQAAERVKG